MIRRALLLLGLAFSAVSLPAEERGKVSLLAKMRTSEEELDALVSRALLSEPGSRSWIEAWRKEAQLGPYDQLVYRPLYEMFKEGEFEWNVLVDNSFVGDAGERMSTFFGGKTREGTIVLAVQGYRGSLGGNLEVMVYRRSEWENVSQLLKLDQYLSGVLAGGIYRSRFSQFADGFNEVSLITVRCGQEHAAFLQFEFGGAEDSNVRPTQQTPAGVIKSAFEYASPLKGVPLLINPSGNADRPHPNGSIRQPGHRVP